MTTTGSVSRMRIQFVAAVLLFTLPFSVVVGIDLFFLNRTSAHHLGDYSGLYSLGVGWLHDRPFILFPWPLWSYGQISAGLTWVMGYPLTSLNGFYAAWTAINVSAVVLAGILMARLLADLRAPLWTALAFGLLGASMPMLTTGWNHSNPYASLGMLLIPGVAAVVRVATAGVPDRMKWYEWLSLAIVGFAAANNFGATILLAAAGLATFAARPEILVPMGPTPEHGHSPKRLRILGSALMSLLAVSLMLGLALKLEVGILPTDFIDIGIPMWAAGTIICHLAQTQLGLLRDDLVRPLVALLAGWLAGVNVAVLHYGHAGLVATNTISAPRQFGFPPVIPSVSWDDLQQGTHWFLFLLLSYALGFAMLVAGFSPLPVNRRRLLRAGGVFVVSVILLLTVITGWDLSFPVYHRPEAFGLDSRYLWLGVASTAAAIYTIVRLYPGSLTAVLVLMLTAPIGVAGIVQSVQAKAVIIASIERTLLATNDAIDQHLSASPDNLVLVANAYYPQRAQVLYAHHNSVLGVPPNAVEALEDGRVRYIGRYGGWVWQDPVEIMRSEGLAPEQILIIGEPADYPATIVIERSFSGTDTIIARIVETTPTEDN